MTSGIVHVVAIGVIALFFMVLYISVRTRFRRVGTFLLDSYIAGLLLFSVGGMLVAWRVPSPEASAIALLGNVTLLSGQVGAVVMAALLHGAYRHTSFADQVMAAPLRQFDRLVGALTTMVVVAVAGIFIYLLLTGPILAVFVSLSAFVSDSALLDVRKAVASGRDGYLAPGYVKQARDILGVILVVYLGWSESRHLRRLRIGLLLLLVVAMVLSGQRAPLVILALSVLTGRYLLLSARPRGESRGMRPVLVGALAVILLMGWMDLLLGRSSTEVPAWGVPLMSLVGLLDRAVVAVPFGNVATFDVWAAGAPTFGQSWLEEMSALMPGPAGEMLTNVLHVAGGGSAEGNLVLGMASDLWLAWGWLGVITFPALFSACVALLDLALYRGGSRFGLATRVYLFFALPIIYSPYGFALYGGAVALTVLAAIAVWRGTVRILRPSISLGEITPDPLSLLQGGKRIPGAS